MVDTQSANCNVAAVSPVSPCTRKYPDKWPLIVNATNQGGVSPLSIFELLISLSKSNTICYLNPSYGYYFEHFYEEPHGMVYLMQTRSRPKLLLTATAARSRC